MPPSGARLHSRAESLAVKFRRGGERGHIHEAINLDRRALKLYPLGHPDRPVSLMWLSNHLSDRFKRLGTMRDLEEAIILAQYALALCPSQSNRHVCLSNLANSLFYRYQHLGNIPDLEAAIVLCTQALKLCPTGDPYCSKYLNNLANYLFSRHERCGETADLGQAIIYGQKALALWPPGHPKRRVSLNGLANHLSSRYQHFGAIVDLQKAITLGQEALTLYPLEHPNRSIPLSSLATNLSYRYERLGVVEDIKVAVAFAREALELRPPGIRGRSKYLNNLAMCLHNRYKALREFGESGEFGELDDINEVIELDREALALRPVGHPDRFMSLNNLAESFFGRYEQLRAIEDINKAIAFARDALAICLLGHIDRIMSLNNLAVYLSKRYHQLQVITDLEEAIDHAREALDLCPLGHLQRSKLLSDLGQYLNTRFLRSNQGKDKEEVFRLYTQMSDTGQTVCPADLEAAKAWVCVAEQHNDPTTLLAYETSLRLLFHHVATLPSLPRHLKVLESITSSLAEDAFSGCLRNHAPAKAVELLEQGRCVFWGQLGRLRSPLDAVVACGPVGATLASKFTQLTSLIHDALDSCSADQQSCAVDQHNRVCQLNIELEGVVSSIRELPGLSRFLLPSLFSDLQRAALAGPVIIVNASEHSCDALVISLDHDPFHIPLTITRDVVRALASRLGNVAMRTKWMDVTRELQALLRELWDLVVWPIVQYIRTICPVQSRIWWCPTAEFAGLPLHAAGPFRRSSWQLSDFYISSYTMTLGALIQARRQEASNSPVGKKRFLAIGQANATGKSQLHCVDAELTHIGQRVKRLARFKRIEGAHANIERVTAALRTHQWVHFACHGIPNRKTPFKSAFALHDGPFSIEKIIQCDLPNAQFAYLSACHTTVGGEDGPDEMIHLASAMQFVGFRSVIGTMWAVDDSQTVKITSVFYSHMRDESGRLDYTRAALALRETMNEVEEVSFDQRVMYVHLGA